MRVTNSPASRKRRIRTIKAAKGFRMRRSKLYRYAADALDHGKQYAYRDRKAKKRTYRYLWQIRINAAARAAGTTYSRFMEGLKAAQITLDRKVLAELAATDAAAFTELVRVSQDGLKAKAANAVTNPTARADKATAKAKADKATAKVKSANKSTAKPAVKATA
jgi:large subunit ribosomal protein L20